MTKNLTFFNVFCFYVGSYINQTCILNDQFVHAFIHAFIHSFIHSFTHSFIHSFIHSFNHLTNFAIGSGISRWALTGVGVDSIVTGAAVLARSRKALVDIDLTVLTAESRHTSAKEINYWLNKFIDRSMD